MSLPRVTLAIPTWNGAAFLAETLASALGQTLREIEVLVADDASSDQGLAIARSFDDPRLRVTSATRRLGIPAHWNRCLAEARAEQVLLLCQDDLLDPRALERLAAALEACPGASVAFGRREIRHEDSALPLRGDTYARVLEAFYASFRDRLTGLELVEGILARGADPTVNLVGEPSFVLLRREALRRSGGFDPALRQLVDWDLWLRLARLGPLAFVDARLGVFRVHAGGASAANQGRLRTRLEFLRVLARIREEYGAELSPGALRQLRREEWRCRRHYVGGLLGIS